MPALATVTSYLNINNNQDELANVDKGVRKGPSAVYISTGAALSSRLEGYFHSCVHYIIIYSSKICGNKLSVHV